VPALGVNITELAAELLSLEVLRCSGGTEWIDLSGLPVSQGQLTNGDVGIGGGEQVKRGEKRAQLKSEEAANMYLID
jgi:hypothetical protein